MRTASHAILKDAKRDLILTVTEEDIKSSKPSDKSACAAAHALCRQEKFKQAWVHKTKTYVQQKDGTWDRYITPKDLYFEIMVFDRGGQMQAGDYRLAAPKGIHKLGAHQKPKGKAKRTAKLPNPIHVIMNVRENAPKGNGVFRQFE